MKKTHWADTSVGDLVFDTNVGRFGTLVRFGQSGNYDIHYIDFGRGIRKIKPMLDFENRYIYYKVGGISNGKQEF